MLHKRHFVLCLTFWVQFTAPHSPEATVAKCCACAIFHTKIHFFLKKFAHVHFLLYLCTRFRMEAYMVAIAQLAEHRIVVPSVVGSSPTSHPKRTRYLLVCRSFFSVSSMWARSHYRGPRKSMSFGESLKKHFY